MTSGVAWCGKFARSQNHKEKHEVELCSTEKMFLCICKDFENYKINFAKNIDCKRIKLEKVIFSCIDKKSREIGLTL